MKRLIIGVLIIMCQTQLAFAWRGEPAGASMMQRMKQELQLTEQQSEQIQQIMQDERGKVHALMQSAGSDREKMRTQFESLRTELHQRLAQVLNPAQMKKFDQLRQQMRERRRSARGTYQNATGTDTSRE